MKYTVIYKRNKIGDLKTELVDYLQFEVGPGQSVASVLDYEGIDKVQFVFEGWPKEVTEKAGELV